MLEKLIPNKTKHLENCWEFLDCPENISSKCQVFISDLGKNCWLVSRATDEKHYQNCLRCPWFKEKNAKLFEILESSRHH